jgi:hypothetical protein
MNQRITPSISRVKTFTLQKIENKHCTPRKSMQTYHTTDERGEKRKIAAIVSHGFFKKEHSVKAIYEREALIIQAFQSMMVGEKVTIDFETDTIRAVLSDKERHTYADAYDEAKLLSRVNNFSGYLSFYLRLLTVIVVVFLSVYGFLSLGEMINTLQQ